MCLERGKHGPSANGNVVMQLEPLDAVLDLHICVGADEPLELRHRLCRDLVWAATLGQIMHCAVLPEAADGVVHTFRVNAMFACRCSDIFVRLPIK